MIWPLYMPIEQVYESVPAGSGGGSTVFRPLPSSPPTPGTVDLVLSTLSSHHWDDIDRAFAEIRRVLRAGGEARIYDLRFAGYGPTEARRAADGAGIDPNAVSHTVLDQRILGLRPYALITIRA